MLDGASLDQLRAFITAVDEGSFSAAGRKLYRVQSAVSGWISGLETQLDVVLFDRTARLPKLTPEGELLLADARNVVSGVDALKARAKLMAGGLEAELSVVVDVFFPTASIAAVAKAFAQRYPLTTLRLFVEGLGAAYQPVLEERCSLRILASLPIEFPSLVSERLGEIPLVMVASPQHPLAKFRGRIPKRELAKHVQLVLTDRSSLMSGKDYGVLSPSTWRLADLSTKHAFLKDGVGWGSMPRHMVETDLAEGRLLRLDVRLDFALTMNACYRASAPPGPAGRWFVDQLKALSGDVPESHEPDDLPASQKRAAVLCVWGISSSWLDAIAFLNCAASAVDSDSTHHLDSTACRCVMRVQQHRHTHSLPDQEERMSHETQDVMPGTPFFQVPEADIDVLRDRLRATRWPPRWPISGWAAGSDADELRRLVAYWADGFDWREQEAVINALPHHRAP